MAPSPPTRSGPTLEAIDTKIVGRAQPLPDDLGDPPSIIGKNIHRYVDLGELGRGTMGQVRRAYDPKLQREVALKAIRRRDLGGEESHRLVAEARAMARLSHANVVAVYDVLSALGDCDDVVLIMELVPGQTLREWAREELRPWRDVVDRFVLAGRGLAAAHAAGLLHRDFKPANVLLGTGDQPSNLTVKVTDFGIAKVATTSTSCVSEAGDRDPDDETQTQAGVTLGTPRYMPPEQHRGEDLDPSADQYGFCVSLWELLCDKPPFSRTALEQKKTAGPPPWPDRSVPRVIANAVRRGLAPAPSDRWPSMEALLSALTQDPLRHRRRAAMAVGGTAIVGLSIGGWHLAGSAGAARCTGGHEQLTGIWDDEQRQRARTAFLAVRGNYASSVWERTALGLDEYASAWTSTHADACEATTVKGEQSTEVMDLRMSCLHRARMELDAVTDVLASADADVVQSAHSLVDGLRPISRCSDIAALQADIEPPLPQHADAVETLRGHLAVAKARDKAGRYEDARSALDEAKRWLDEVSYGPVHTEVALAQGRVLESLGEYEAAESAYRAALRSAARWRQEPELEEAASALMFCVGYRQEKPTQGLRYRDLAEGIRGKDVKREAHFLTNLGSIRQVQGRFGEAETDHRKALALQEVAFGPSHPHLASTLSRLANTLWEQGRYRESEQAHRRAISILEESLGSDHPNVANATNSLAASLMAQGKLDEAESEIQRAVRIQEETLGPEHPTTLMSRSNLASVLGERGETVAAEREFRRLLSIKERALGPEHSETTASRLNLAHTLFGQGKYEAAEAEYRRVLATQSHTLGPEHPTVADTRLALARTLHRRSKFEEAELQLRQALEHSEAALGNEHPNVAAIHAELAYSLWARRDHAAAQQQYQRAVQIFENALGPDHPRVAATRSSLSIVLREQGKLAEAEAEQRAALAAQQGRLPTGHPQLASSKHVLGRVLLDQGRSQEALSLLEQAWRTRQRDEIPAKRRGDTAFLLAQALWAKRGEPERRRARSLARTALEAFEAAGQARADSVTEVRRWLRRHGG